jgi:hypothetical protein
MTEVARRTLGGECKADTRKDRKAEMDQTILDFRTKTDVAVEVRVADRALYLHPVP